MRLAALCLLGALLAVLLRRGAGRYAVIGIAAFAAGAALTIVCVRRRKRRTDRTSAAEESEEIL